MDWRFIPIFVEIRFSSFVYFLVGCHASAVIFRLGNVFFAKLAPHPLPPE